MERVREFLSDPWRAATAALSVGVVALLIVALGGGGSSTADPGTDGSTTTTSAEPTQSTTPGTPTTVPGLGFRGAVGVKVDNAPAARPQAGLDLVPLLAEYMAEGGITRFIAVVGPDASGHIGPVRSLRPVDADLFPLFAPTVASTGGQAFVIREIDGSGTVRAEPDLFQAFTIAERPSPHNIFVDLSALLPEVQAFNPADPVFLGGSLPGGADAPQAAVSAWDLEWRFEDGAYARYQGGEPFQTVNLVDDEAVTLTHDVLIFLQVGQRSAGYTDSNGAEVFTYDVIGGGDMVALHDGEATRGTWARRSHAEGYQLTDENGATIGIPEGRVYVAFLPQGVDVEH